MSQKETYWKGVLETVNLISGLTVFVKEHPDKKSLDEFLAEIGAKADLKCSAQSNLLSDELGISKELGMTKRPEYWLGVRDTASTIRRFQEWKKSHPKTKTLIKFLNELALKAEDKLGIKKPALAEELGIAFEEEERGTISEPVAPIVKERLIAVTPEPVAVEPVKIPEPVVVEPVKIPEPVVVEPVKIPEPVVVEPVKIPEPVVVEPVKIPEPVAVEPVKIPEPVAVEPVKIPEPVVVEPVKIPEPVAVEPEEVYKPVAVEPEEVYKPVAVEPEEVYKPVGAEPEEYIPVMTEEVTKVEEPETFIGFEGQLSDQSVVSYSPEEPIYQPPDSSVVPKLDLESLPALEKTQEEVVPTKTDDSSLVSELLSESEIEDEDQQLSASLREALEMLRDSDSEDE